MTLLITGAHGQLGQLVAAQARGRGIAATAFASGELNIVDSVPHLERGDIVLNCAAYTQVDGAESDPERAYAVNAGGPANLARACAAAGADLIQVSTDYVFGAGQPGRSGWEPDDQTSPSTVYGKSKLAGEVAARAAHPGTVVVRTAWLYSGGPDSEDFVGTMRRLAASGASPTVVNDQIGSPTYAADLATGLLELAARISNSPGAALRGAALRGATLRGATLRGATLHATNAGATSWYDLARAVFAGVSADPERVQSCSTEQFPRPAPRPRYSVLSPASWLDAGLPALPGWQDGLHRALLCVRD